MSVRDVVQAAAGAGGDNLYVEDVFSTYLFTGNGSTQTITNGIDLAGEGGLVWLKNRDSTSSHRLVDTVRGALSTLFSESTSAALPRTSPNDDVDSFTSTGFVAGNYCIAADYASWTFRKAPKFFDVVTYTGNDVAGRTVAHNLGSVPGCIIVKNITSGARSWEVFHTSLGPTKTMQLNLATSATTSINYWNNTSPTSTEFTVGINNTVNTGTHSYVAYLFAHDAGGFGDDGEQNVISCGSYTGNGQTAAGSAPVINLGWEPQWLLIKRAGPIGDGEWVMLDNMRGINSKPTDDRFLFANLADAEAGNNYADINATGFEVNSSNGNVNDNGYSYIYIAIRRPMKTPEAGTEVFAPITYTGNATSGTLRTTGILTDVVWSINKQGYAPSVAYDRLRGSAKRLEQSTTGVEISESLTAIGVSGFDTMSGYTAAQDQSAGGINFNAWTYVNYAFKRAPGFMDVVCYTGNSVTGREIPHNLGVAPELMIVKSRNNTGWWVVYSGLNTSYLKLFDTHAIDTATFWNNTSPTSSVFTVNSHINVNLNPYTYVAYLFATLAGVSKVGSYTGTGADLNIDCGFSAGARFVLIKRTDTRITVAPTTGWYVWDSARGIAAGNDPYSLLNSTAAEVTNTDYIDPLSSGFTVTSSAPAALNASGGTYIFLAIA